MHVCMLLLLSCLSDEPVRLSGSETNMIDNLKLQLDQSIARHLGTGYC